MGKANQKGLINSKTPSSALLTAVLPNDNIIFFSWHSVLLLFFPQLLVFRYSLCQKKTWPNLCNALDSSFKTLFGIALPRRGGWFHRTTHVRKKTSVRTYSPLGRRNLDSWWPVVCFKSCADWLRVKRVKGNFGLPIYITRKEAAIILLPQAEKERNSPKIFMASFSL